MVKGHVDFTTYLKQKSFSIVMLLHYIIIGFRLGVVYTMSNVPAKCRNLHTHTHTHHCK